MFPADDAVADFLRSEGRAEAHRRRTADTDAHYALTEEIALDDLVPLIACPSSPGKVVPVREVVGKPIGQVVIGSSASHAMTL